MNFIFRAFITCSALLLFVALYLINQEITLFDMNEYLSYIIYVSLPFLFSWLGILVSRKLAGANLGEVKFIETSNNDFLSNYLAFFFVALSIDNTVTFIFCFGLTAIFTLFSRVSYFNPIFLVFGYNFYYVHLGSNSKVMLITSQKIKCPADIPPDKKYKRINDYTFIG